MLEQSIGFNKFVSKLYLCLDRVLYLESDFLVDVRLHFPWLSGHKFGKDALERVLLYLMDVDFDNTDDAELLMDQYLEYLEHNSFPEMIYVSSMDCMDWFQYEPNSVGPKLSIIVDEVIATKNSDTLDDVFFNAANQYLGELLQTVFETLLDHFSERSGLYELLSEVDLGSKMKRCRFCNERIDMESSKHYKHYSDPGTVLPSLYCSEQCFAGQMVKIHLK